MVNDADTEMPRLYREQLLRIQLKDVLLNPWADVRDVMAAEGAIKQKLDEQDRAYEVGQLRRKAEYRRYLIAPSKQSLDS